VRSIISRTSRAYTSTPHFHTLLLSLPTTAIFNAALDKVWGTPGLNTNAFLVSIASFGVCTLLFGTYVCYALIYLSQIRAKSHRAAHVTRPTPPLSHPLRWVERNGPFKSVAITLFLTPAGWALACLGSYQKNYGVELLYGIAHGFGCGLAYISITSALQRWFPEFKGYVVIE